MKCPKTLLLVGIFLILCSVAWADIPKQINFQGVLRDTLGNPYPDGNYSITFRVYNAPSGGNILWQEGQLIAISGGLFTHILGSAISIPDSVFNNSLRWLGIQVAGNPEITPRTQLNSAPYSFQALRSDSAGVATLSLDLTCTGCVGTSDINATQVQRRVTGTAPAGQYIRAINEDGSVVTALDQGATPSGWTDDGNVVRLTTASDLVGIGTSTPLGLLHLKGNNYKLLLESSGNADVVIGRADTTRYGNYILANGDPSQSVNNRWAIGLRNGDSKLHLYSEVNSSNVMVLEPGGNVGVGTTTPAARLHVSRGAGQGLPGNLVNEGLVVSNNALAMDNASIEVIGGSSGYSRITFGENASALTGFVRYNNGTDALEFGTGGFQVMTLDGSLLGVGEVNPSTRLYVSEFQSTVATFNRNGNDGTLVNLSVSGVTQGTISVSAGTVSYNAFTGSHYGWTDEGRNGGNWLP